MTPNLLDLTGRRILLTGASVDSDIGRTIAVTLAGLGARLVLTGRRADALEGTRALLPGPAGHHRTAPFDLTDLDGIPGWMKGLAADGGPLDGLVHSASVQGYTVLRTLNAADIDRYFRLNTGAAAMLARGFQQKSVAADGGAIVYIGSVAGLAGQKGRSLYAASKAGLTALAQSLALELAGRRIRVNVVAPAVVLGRQAERQFAMLPADQRAALDAAHPLGYGTPEDVAAAAAFLLAETGRWITGVTLPVDGGYCAG